MSPKLIEAVSELKLHPGQAVAFQVDGQEFRLSALNGKTETPPPIPPMDPIPREYLENVMLEPWVDLSALATRDARVFSLVERREHLPPDVPEIPTGEETL